MYVKPFDIQFHGQIANTVLKFRGDVVKKNLITRTFCKIIHYCGEPGIRRQEDSLEISFSDLSLTYVALCSHEKPGLAHHMPL